MSYKKYLIVLMIASLFGCDGGDECTQPYEENTKQITKANDPPIPREYPVNCTGLKVCPPNFQEEFWSQDFDSASVNTQYDIDVAVQSAINTELAKNRTCGIVTNSVSCVKICRPTKDSYSGSYNSSGTGDPNTSTGSGPTPDHLE